MKPLKININFEIVLLFLGVFLIYIHNLSPSVYGGDSGDFLAAAISRGVAHPSGYPLYTILGILLTSLSLPLTYAAKFGIVSAFFASVSVVIVYLISWDLVKNRFIALVSALTLAFIYPFWLYAEIVEVISLNSFFILLLTYLTIKLIGKWNNRYFYILSFSIGLSLTNNLTVVLALPGVALALLIARGRNLFKIRQLALALLSFVLGLSPYIYIPFAARLDPVVNWGVAKTLDNFWSLITRQDYGWINTAVDKNLILLHLSVYLSYWKVYLNPTILVVALMGLAFLIIKKNYALLTLFLTSSFLLGPFFVIYLRSPLQNYLSFGILEKFYVGGFLFLCLFYTLGIKAIYLIIPKILTRPDLSAIFQKVALGVFLVVAVAQFINNFPKTNLKSVNIGDNYGEDLLLSLPQNSILFLTRDTTAFNARYMQLAYQVRPDVYIPGKDVGFEELLRQVGAGEEVIERYNIEQKGGIEGILLKTAVSLILTKRPVFSEVEYGEEETPFGKIVSVPYGLLYKLEYEDRNNLSKDDYLKKMQGIFGSYQLDHLEKNQDLINSHFVFADIKKSYSLAFWNSAKYIAEHYQDPESAKDFVIKAAKLDPLIQNQD